MLPNRCAISALFSLSVTKSGAPIKGRESSREGLKGRSAVGRMVIRQEPRCWCFAAQAFLGPALFPMFGPIYMTGYYGSTFHLSSMITLSNKFLTNSLLNFPSLAAYRRPNVLGTAWNSRIDMVPVIDCLPISPGPVLTTDSAASEASKPILVGYKLSKHNGTGREEHGHEQKRPLGGRIRAVRRNYVACSGLMCPWIRDPSTTAMPHARHV